MCPEEVKKEESINEISENENGDSENEEVKTNENAEINDEASLWKKKYEEAERRNRDFTDIKELSKEFPEAAIGSIEDTRDPLRYRILRDSGLSAKEAFLATSSDMVFAPSKSHLSSVLTKESGSASHITRDEYEVIKSVFGDSLSNERIAELYKRVSRSGK